MRDLDELYAERGTADEKPDDVLHSTCNPKLPDAGEVWGGVVDQVDGWREELAEAV